MTMEEELEGISITIVWKIKDGNMHDKVIDDIDEAIESKLKYEFTRGLRCYCDIVNYIQEKKHSIDQWAYQGTDCSRRTLDGIDISTEQAFDADTYQILVKPVLLNQVEIELLNPAS